MGDVYSKNFDTIGEKGNPNWFIQKEIFTLNWCKKMRIGW